MKATINGISIHYQVDGPDTAPPVLLHHPLATNLTIWDELTTALTPAYRVIRLDARGHGSTDAPKGAYDFDVLSGDVIGLMDHLGIQKCRFLGLSMGGMVGQHLGVKFPDRFDSLTLVSTASEMASLGAQIWEDRIRLAAEKGMPAIVDGAMARWVAPAAMTGKPELVARLRQMILTTPPDGYVGWCHAISTLNITSRLKEIKLPTLVVVGALDPATPPAAARLIHGEIAGSRYAEVANTSHMLQVEEPGQFHDVVRGFLDRNGPKTA